MFNCLGAPFYHFNCVTRSSDIHVYEVNVRVKSANTSEANVVHMEAPRSPFGMVKRWSVSVVCVCSSWIRRIYRWRSLPIDKRKCLHVWAACMIEECTSLKLRKYTHGPTPLSAHVIVYATSSETSEIALLRKYVFVIN